MCGVDAGRGCRPCRAGSAGTTIAAQRAGVMNRGARKWKEPATLAPGSLVTGEEVRAIDVPGELDPQHF